MWLMMADFSGDPGLRMETWKGAVVDSSLGLDPEPPPPHFDGDRIVRQGLGCPCGVCAGDAGFSPGVKTGWMVSPERLNCFLELFQKHGGSGGELAFMSRGLGTCCTLLRASRQGNGGDPGLLVAVRSKSHVHFLGEARFAAEAAAWLKLARRWFSVESSRCGLEVPLPCSPEPAGGRAAGQGAGGAAT